MIQEGNECNADVVWINALAKNDSIFFPSTFHKMNHIYN